MISISQIVKYKFTFYKYIHVPCGCAIWLDCVRLSFLYKYHWKRKFRIMHFWKRIYWTPSTTSHKFKPEKKKKKMKKKHRVVNAINKINSFISKTEMLYDITVTFFFFAFLLSITLIQIDGDLNSNQETTLIFFLLLFRFINIYFVIYGFQLHNPLNTIGITLPFKFPSAII